MREVVEYAAQRFITVVPEIELPGHCRAALACYSHLSCPPRLGSEQIDQMRAVSGAVASASLLELRWANSNVSVTYRPAIM